MPVTWISRCSSPCHQEVKEGGYTSCACLKKNDGYNIQTTVEENSGGLMYVRNYLSAAHAKLNFHHGLVQPQALLDFARSQVLSPCRAITFFEKLSRNELPSWIWTKISNQSPPYRPVIPFNLCSTFLCELCWFRMSHADMLSTVLLLMDQIRMITIQMKDKPRANQNQLLSGTAPLVGLFAKL
ncbi:hypothetical protein IGI04_029644 [Brassica rapa subsp. trilocularis]|uniref:Uncharacterized protein n=1 Tax=Brassica rapa subsp. trilocularis TaxID=1813537 RepID=A0ABQ7LNF2_BRACM|nr:hypothetical protein IGI04_029644 [Brassica rapa subsp. trilocularis]